MIKWIIVAIVVSLVLYAIAAVLATMFDNTVPIETSPSKAAEGKAASDPLTIMSWNLGYSGLGEESDFTADGGKMFLPPSRAIVEKNLAGIAGIVAAQKHDVVLTQELARPGLLTRGVDVVDGVRKALPDYAMFFTSDIHTTLMPTPLSLQHGLGAFPGVAVTATRIRRLPEEPQAMMGLVRRHYHLQQIDLDVSGRPWSLLNVHLSAFDEGANTRMQQVAAVFQIAEELYHQGRAVVISGDWNMVLVETHFPNTSAKEALFWVHDFPKSALPQGWKIAADPTTPSVRTNERPYHPKENFTTVIDGMAVSPNVDIQSVKGLDVGFHFSDHQPVLATFHRND